MRETYEMEIAGLKRSLPICRAGEDLCIAAFIMFGDVELTVRCAEKLLEKAPDFDVIVTAESKGIPLAYEVARQSGRNDYIVIRKDHKLYMKDVLEIDVKSITTDHMQKLCISREDAETIRGKRVALVDDVISTGETLSSMEALIEKAGGIVTARMAVLAEGDAASRSDITYLAELPLFDKEGGIISANRA